MNMKIQNKDPRSDWKAGDICYYHAAGAGSIQAQRVVTAAGKIAYLDDGTAVRAEYLFDTRAAAFQGWRDAQKDLQAAYEAGIATVRDLLQFALDHPVAHMGIYSDNAARTAFMNRARDLLSVDLEP